MKSKIVPNKIFLRSHGLKATRERLALLLALRGAKKPMTIVALLRKAKGTRMDQSTVYRTLTSMVSQGLVRQVDFRHGHAHFELVPKDDHHHIVCIRCERVEDIFGCGADKLIKRALKKSSHFKSISDHTIELFGVCKSCV